MGHSDGVAPRLDGLRLLVVGASSGIGRALVLEAAREGARVAAAARRIDKLEALAAEADGPVTALHCDVRDPASCESVVSGATRALGGLDALVYATGAATFSEIADADAELWRESLEINLIGASLVTRAALPALKSARGRVIYLSSISADDEPPRIALGVYAIAKQALNKMARVWQRENREVSFTRVSIGDTGATDMASEWDMSVAGEYVKQWLDQGVMFGRTMVPESVARHIVDLLATDETVDATRITPRFAVE